MRSGACGDDESLEFEDSTDCSAGINGDFADWLGPRTPAGPACKGGIGGRRSTESQDCACLEIRSPGIAGDRSAACSDFIDTQTVLRSASLDYSEGLPCQGKSPLAGGGGWIGLDQVVNHFTPDSAAVGSDDNPGNICYCGPGTA